MRFFAVKNLERFQHYKDRRPPWIKLYQDVLEDYEFTRLPDASKMHLLAIWLLASRTDNKVPYDADWISTAIHATEPVDLDRLVSAGFITPSEPASGALAERKRVAMPEVETETEKKHPTVADAPVAKRPRKPLAGVLPKYPLFDKATCDQLYDAWTKFGKPHYSSFRSAFGPLFGERPDHPLPDVLAAIREAISRAERDPYVANNLTPHSFVNRLGYWIGEAKGRPAVDPATGIPLAVMR